MTSKQQTPPLRDAEPLAKQRRREALLKLRKLGDGQIPDPETLDKHERKKYERLKQDVAYYDVWLAD